MSLYFSVMDTHDVVHLQAVLANGEVIKTGSRARKSAAG